MTKAQKLGHIIFGVLFISTLLSYSAINAWFAWDSLEEEWKSFQICDLKDDVPSMNEVMEKEIWGRYTFIETYGAIQLLLGKQEENSFDNVKDKEGYLFSGNFWSGFGEDQKILAERVRRLKDYLAVQNTKVGFVLCPEKPVREEASYPGIPYGSFKRQGDDLISWLDYYSVPYLDLRDTIANSDLTYEETWFRTDHHWTPLASFEGYKGVIDWMNEEFDAGLDPHGVTRNIANYDQISYSEVMLGSQGRDAGLIYSGGMEDYLAVVPKEEGSYRWNYNNVDRREGAFREAFLNEDIYGMDPYSINAGNYYLHEIAYYSRQLNLNKQDGDRILLLRDSFASPVGAFLAQNFSLVDMIWSLQYSPDEVEEILGDNTYDYVIVMLYPSNLSDASFPFFTESPVADEAAEQESVEK